MSLAFADCRLKSPAAKLGLRLQLTDDRQEVLEGYAELDESKAQDS